MKIKFTKPIPSFSATPDLSVMKNLQQQNIPVASSCGGEGICTKCKITLIDGAENLTPATHLEQLAQLKSLLKKTERLSCQCKLHSGDIIIDTSYW